jgi:ATP-binding cassette subfamily B protein
MALRLVWAASPRLTVAIATLLSLQAALTPLQLVLVRALLDRATDELGSVPAGYDKLALLWPLPVLFALVAATLVLGQMMQPLALTVRSLAGDQLTAYVTEQLIRAANRWRGLARFEDPSFADDLHRARGQAAHSGLDLLMFGAETALSLVSASGLALVLMALQPLVPVLVVLAALPQMTRQWTYTQQTGGHIYDHTAEGRRLEYAREVLLTPEPAKDVRLYGLGPFFRRHYDDLFARTTATLTARRRRLAGSLALASVLAALAPAAVSVAVVWLVAHGDRSLGDLALYGGAATLLWTTLVGLSAEVGVLSLVLSVLPSLQRVLQAPPDLPQPLVPRPVPRPIAEGIAFEHVSFTYPGQTVPVLRDLSLTLRPGECVALVGHNGAGKTTLIKLLLRLYDPTAGRVLLDGVDLRAYDLDDLRRAMGIIFQDFVRYDLTAGENIGVGQIEAMADRRRLLTAAARAGADRLLAALPEGLDTPLGRALGGRDLSGGEWQSLALARAFVRDCQLLVLDEPTAALDVQTEHAVYTRFHTLTRGRMTVLISHRFSTVRMADRILYLSGGQVQEEGTHEQLLAARGAYARLYHLQAAQFSLSTDEGRPA